ncbi:MAG: hypothetical protein BWY86_00033 [Candidatus Aminicenantes bacterium ADurb.Bin508]|nr:MAG: hypothetical protein BWY86_00033 [Candidatus Aminicenantes bacterium ADurb.Bin508]
MVDCVADQEEWLSLPQVASRAGIPESSARRYAETFKAFLKVRKGGRRTLYHYGTAEALAGIAFMYEQGQGTKEIMELLRKRGPETVDMEEAPLARGGTPQDTRALALPLQQIAQAIQILAVDREEIKALIHKNRAQAEKIQDLEERLSALEKQKEGEPRGWFPFFRRKGGQK